MKKFVSTKLCKECFHHTLFFIIRNVDGLAMLLKVIFHTKFLIQKKRLVFTVWYNDVSTDTYDWVVFHRGAKSVSKT